MVRAILKGQWTNDPPAWADENVYYDMVPVLASSSDAYYTRAVQTAEAFILLFRAFNPLFDESRFLAACGLVEPAKKGTRR